MENNYDSSKKQKRIMMYQNEEEENTSSWLQDSIVEAVRLEIKRAIQLHSGIDHNDIHLTDLEISWIDLVGVLKFQSDTTGTILITPKEALMIFLGGATLYYNGKKFVTTLPPN